MKFPFWMVLLAVSVCAVSICVRVLFLSFTNCLPVSVNPVKMPRLWDPRQWLAILA